MGHLSELWWPRVQPMTPTTRHELVMWLAFTAFYAALVWLITTPLHFSFNSFAAALLATTGTAWGAFHARSIHQDNKIRPTRTAVELPDADLWEGRS